MFVSFLNFISQIVAKGMQLHPMTTAKVELAEIQPGFYGGRVGEFLSHE